jgi:hypothetical protein
VRAVESGLLFFRENQYKIEGKMVASLGRVGSSILLSIGNSTREGLNSRRHAKGTKQCSWLHLLDIDVSVSMSSDHANVVQHTSFFETLFSILYILEYCNRRDFRLLYICERKMARITIELTFTA